MTKRSETKSGKGLSAFWRVLSIVLYLAVIVLLIPLLLPKLLGYETLHVISGSMEPAYPVGSMVLIDEIEPEAVVPGDVIAFADSLGGALTLHRVTEVHADEREFVTKGDANPIEDIFPVSFDSLRGVAVRAFPRLGGLYALLTSVWGKILIAVMVIVAALISGGVSRKEKTEETEESKTLE